MWKYQRKEPSKNKYLIDNPNFNDNECFKLCLIRYLNPLDHHLARIRKVNKDFARVLDFKDIEVPIKNRNKCKIEKELYQHSCFELWNKEKYQILMSKDTFKKHVHLLLIRKEDKRQ